MYHNTIFIVGLIYIISITTVVGIEENMLPNTEDKAVRSTVIVKEQLFSKTSDLIANKKNNIGNSFLVVSDAWARA